MFDPEWLEIASHMEYPFDLTQVLALKFGYEDVEKMKIDSRPRFSLLENGILEMDSCRLLLINGMLDELFPIEDCLLPLRYGSVKECRFFEDSKHMGEPNARKHILQWVESIFRTVDVAKTVEIKEVEGEKNQAAEGMNDVQKPVENGTNSIANAVNTHQPLTNGAVKKPFVSVKEVAVETRPVLNGC